MMSGIIKVIFCVVLIASGHTKAASTQSRVSSTLKPVRLKKNKPSLYLTYERYGKQNPLRTGESEERIWLRLHNNTHWAVSYPAFDVPGGYGEVGMYHEVVAVKDTGEEILQVGYGPPHVYSVAQLLPGKSSVFSVPREHLSKDLAIRISFNYPWEDKDDVFAGRAPRHYVYFFSSNLPIALQTNNQ